MRDDMQEGAEAGALSAEFAAISNQAATIDGQADEVLTGVKPGQAPVEVIDPAEAWAEIPQMVGMILGAALPEVKPVFNPDACYAWGKAMHRVSEKRGWQSDGLPPEASAILATAMFALPTVAAIKTRQRAAADARQAKEQGATAGLQLTGIPGGDEASR